MIWTGTESNTIYHQEEDEIQILSKRGNIMPYSCFLDQPVRLALNRKYYLCHPTLK